MYPTLESCVIDLERHGHLIRIKEEVDPYLEMAAIHLHLFERQGPALLFERVKGSRYRAASNLFGNLERSKFLFRKTWDNVQKVVALRNDPMAALKSPFSNLSSGLAALKALPVKKSFPAADFEEIHISELPQIQHWPMDGGAFITLPQVYTEDPEQPGIMHANLGMYRIQLSGNDYEQDKEIGLHYQIHRGIGIHQTKANKKGIPLQVSCFVGGPPAHSLAAVMPLPEGLSEMTFAGLLAGRRFRYSYHQGHCISNDADFIITGSVFPGDNKPEGPFGDHLGYYSLTHPFPVMKVDKVYARKNAIWPFTVVGRPPQEDTAFGALIHELTGDAITSELPGIKEVHAVDAAGVHPLLLAIGSERYTPYLTTQQPAELLTQANHILGTNQLSLAKYLLITAAEDQKKLSTHDIPAFLSHMLERIDLSRDVHFHTHTTIDTLDYSGTGLNSGSKVVLAAYGPPIRQLCTEVPRELTHLPYFEDPQLVMPGVIAMRAGAFRNYEAAASEMHTLSDMLMVQAGFQKLQHIPLIVVCDDSRFLAERPNNFLWVTFTRSNPAHDIYGVDSFIHYKHWGCRGPMIIDARKKPHHAPVLEHDPQVAKNMERLFKKGASLEKWA